MARPALPVRTLSGLALALILCASACSRPEEISNLGCAWPEELDRAWWASDEVNERCGYSAACWRRAIEDARRLRDRYSSELIAHRIFVRMVRIPDDALPEYEDLRRQTIAEYRDAARRHPKNPAYPYLLARLEPDSRISRKLVDEAIRLDPAFAWARLERVRQTPDGAPEAEMKVARDDYVAFGELCPARSSEILTFARYFDDVDTWRTVAAELRQRPAAALGRSASHDFQAIWSLEFARAAPEDHESVRGRIRADIEKLRADTAAPDVERFAALAAGYEMLGDEAGKKSVEDEMVARFPCAGWTFDVILAREMEARGESPPDEATQPKWIEGYVGAMSPWAQRCPDSLYFASILLTDVGLWKEAPPELVDETVRHALAKAGPRSRSRAAGILLARGMDLDRVAGLSDDNQAWLERRWAAAQVRGYSEKDLRDIENRYLRDTFANQALRVRLALARKDPGSADLALARLDEHLEKQRRAAREEAERPAWQEAQRWKLRAEIDGLRGREAESLEAYARSLRAYEKDTEVASAARALYVRLQGSDAGYEAWRRAALEAARSDAAAKASKNRRPFAAFSLADLGGRSWTLADLSGKATLVNVWATWCGPCQMELPAVQELYEKVGSTSRVVTINVDENPGLIEPYMKKRGFTFPVLIGKYAAYQTFSPNGIPQNYIVDPRGTIVSDGFGFDGDAARWVEEKRRELREAAAAP